MHPTGGQRAPVREVPHARVLSPFVPNLLRMLLRVGRDEKLRRITADILPENRDMQHVSERLGFRLRHVAEDQIVKAEIEF